MTKALPLDRFPVHLGLGARACVEPEFTGVEWYEAYVDRHAADGAEGRVVAIHAFDTDWSGWEMHPEGDEVVVCLSGRLVLYRRLADGAEEAIALTAGEYTINPAGTWHTADVPEPARALFITAGKGTQHRDR